MLQRFAGLICYDNEKRVSDINQISNMNPRIIKSVHSLVKSSVFCIVLFVQQVHSTEQVDIASAGEVEQALKTLVLWIQNYQDKNYTEQYKLVHPLIQHYKDKKKWKKAMKKSLRVNGELLDYKILAVGATTPDKIPCTEMRHCYRKDIQVVLIIMNSLYKIFGEKEKEYVVMANSSHGWRFGGGTFLNIPFGETMTILDRRDERRYEYKGIDTRL